MIGVGRPTNCRTANPGIWAAPLFIAFAFLLFALNPATASAHAQYDHSDPAANAIVAAAPSQVAIWFTEHLETSGTSAQLFDSQGQQVPGTASRLGDEPKQLILDLPGGLANGTYTVAWQTLSADDGHPAQGYFAFTIGTAADVQQAVVPTATTENGAPQWMRTTSRWAALLGVAAASAIWPIWLFVFRPSYSEVWQAGPRLVRRTRQIAVAALFLAFAGDLYALFVQAADLSSGPYLDRLQTVLSDTRYGRLWLLRIALLFAYSIALLVAAWWWPRRRPVRSVVTLLLALALPLPISLNAHASAEPIGRTVAIATDYVHLMAASIWIGGLFMLVGALAPSLRDLTAVGRRVMLTHLLPRFSMLALTSWGVLILTGLYQAWLEVGNLDGLLDTSYGRALLIKLIILVPLLVLAAFNLIVVTGRIRASSDSESTIAWSRNLKRAVTAEAVLVVILLLVVGRLTSLPPARGVLATRTSAVELSLQATDRTGTLTITPGAAGPNHYRLELSGSSVPAGTEALLRLQLPSQNIGEKEVKLAQVADGAFEGHGSEFSIAGDWQITAIVRKIGEFQWQASTQTAIPAQAERVAQPRAAWHFGNGGLIGLALLVVSVAGIVFAWAAGRSRLRLEIAGLATCAVVAGLLLLLQARTTTTANASVAPEISAVDQAMITRGQTIYDMNCATCHGATGKGDGPSASGLNPPAADFTSPLHAMHKPEDLVYWVKNGIAGSAMPAFGSTLTDEQVQDVLAYVAALSQGENSESGSSTAQVRIPDPSECTIPPADISVLIANRTPTTGEQPVDVPVGPDFAWPTGNAATQAETEGITRTIQEFVACSSARDFARRSALYTSHYLQPFFNAMDEQNLKGITDAAAAPASPVPEGERGWVQEIRDVRSLPDGRVGAHVVIDDPVNHPHVISAVLVFAPSGDRWLIDEIHPDPNSSSPTATP